MRTHVFDHFCIGDVVRDDFGHLGEMPSVPFLHTKTLVSTHTIEREKKHLDTHSIDINLLVQIIKERNGLNDHRVHFIG